MLICNSDFTAAQPIFCSSDPAPGCGIFPHWGAQDSSSTLKPYAWLEEPGLLESSSVPSSHPSQPEALQPHSSPLLPSQAELSWLSQRGSHCIPAASAHRWGAHLAGQDTQEWVSPASSGDLGGWRRERAALGGEGAHPDTHTGRVQLTLTLSFLLQQFL